jgi:general secretion pathway protein B
MQKRKKERKGTALPADQMIAAPADIKLSGIAWQDDRPARRAVVNGFLMQEGGVVSGARITDIFQDRVRFSLSGKSFEIPLISSGTPAAEKR